MLVQRKSISQHLLSQSQIIQPDPFDPITISYQNLEITAKIKKTTKTILHEQKGNLLPGTFTVILGPSGSGKTTLLNFLSGRLVSNNLEIEGNYYLNGNAVQSVQPYANNIAYIMQDDILLEQMTPKQSFMFAADLRLAVSKKEKIRRVRILVQKLGLNDCCDTKIGSNTQKGISGGQRKRTSIGVDLITNPSMIFLDEPTTGLDSTTALQVIILLRQLANEGRTVVSTIHQPSSEVFAEFDRLMLLVQGRCIFQGRSKEAEGYFKILGYECPTQMNHAQFYMQLMSFHYKQAQDLESEQRNQDYEKKREEYIKKMNQFQTHYKKSKLYTEMNLDNIKKPILQRKTQEYNISVMKQFWYIYKRAVINQIRYPLNLTLRVFQSIFAAVIVLLVFGRLNTTDKDDITNSSLIQSTRGIVFFLVSFCVMTGIQATLNTFSGQKPMFLRQRFSKTYSTLPYFWGRSLATLPFQILYGSIPSLIIFWGCGLNNNASQNFPLLVFISNSLYFASVSFGLFYSAVIPKLQTAMALVPVLIIPFMLLSGFFISLDKVPKVFIPLEYLSPFRYGYQATIMNQFHNKKYSESAELQFTPHTIILNVIVLISIGLCLRLLSLIAMYVVSNPKRPRINQEAKNKIKGTFGVPENDE